MCFNFQTERLVILLGLYLHKIKQYEGEKTFWRSWRIISSLYHGEAGVEWDFSMNKEMLEDSLQTGLYPTIFTEVRFSTKDWVSLKKSLQLGVQGGTFNPPCGHKFGSWKLLFFESSKKLEITYTLFYCKNLAFENIQAQICQNLRKS